VLIGSTNEKLQRWGHDQLEAFGSGKERKRTEWASLARDLVREGYLRRDAERYNVLDVTEKGQAVLDGRVQAMLTESPALPASTRRVAIECDETLFERLRALRKRLADEQNVAAYIVFSDVALRQMSREYPATEEEFSRISGVGDKKLREFGEAFMREIAEHLRSNPRQTFTHAQVRGSEAREGRTQRELGDSPALTLRRFREGKSVDEIAAERGLVVGTIASHLAFAAEAGEEVDLARFLTPEQEKEIEAAFESIGWRNIVGARERLGARYEYGALRIYRAMRGPDRREDAAQTNVVETSLPSETRLRGVSTVAEEGPALGSARACRTTESPARSPASAPAPA
jgi:ATP-dependent DNA helicase RecQ